MVVARIFNLHVVKDMDGLIKGTGEATWVFGAGTTDRAVTGVLPGHKHLCISDNESIGENLFPYFSIPIFDEKRDRMGNALLLVFGALEEDGGEWLGPVLGVIGAGIGLYFGGSGGAGAGGTIGEKVGSALAIIVCKDEDANIGTLATTIFTQDVFSHMDNPFVDSAGMDVQIDAYGTGGLGGSCVVKFRIEVERA
jgi:hypothetical protein